MSAPILLTKLFIPAKRPELVSRSHLIELLNRGLHRKLTLISAPAGFGKTTLVTDWLQSKGDEATSPFTICWLSLDEGDSDPARFLAYFIAALNQIDGVESLGDSSLTMLGSPQPLPIEAILTPLINEIAPISTRIIFVLDDYHLIDPQPIQDIISFLLENLPPQLHLVISTREDPLLPLPRLRARDQLTELRAADLRFTSAEAAEFLNQVMGLNLSMEDIDALETRTEGWIAGLQLAAITLQGQTDASRLIQTFTGSNRLVLDYLIEEVLNQQPEDIQNFLLQTAVLNRLTGSLCDAVTDKKKGQIILELLDRANLFIIPLDNNREWYRYHHLFADLLKQRLAQTQPELVPLLHKKASKWYERHGFMDDAIEHALVINDFNRAAFLIDENADNYWQQGEHRKLPRLLNSVPFELIVSKPQLCVFHAWYSFISGQQEMTSQCLQAAEQALELKSVPLIEGETQAQAGLPVQNKELLLGRIAAIRAFMDSFQGDLSGLIRHANQALDYLPERERIWRSITALTLGDVYGFQGDMAACYDARYEAYRSCKAAGDSYYTILASSKLAISLLAQGQLQEAVELCQEQIHAADEFGHSQSPMKGFLMVLLGEALTELNDLDEALDQAKNGIELTNRSENLLFVGWGYISLMKIQFSRGDLAAVEEMIHKLENLARESNVPGWIMGLMGTWQVRTWLAQNNLEAASRWASARELTTDIESPLLQEINYFTLFDYIVLSRIWIAQGQLDEAIKLLIHLLSIADKGNRIANMIEILMLQALAYQKQDDTPRSLSALRRSLSIAEPRGFIRTFVDEGPPMARLLYEALSRGIAPDYVRKLLAAFPETGPEKTAVKQPAASDTDLIEPLSDRELEVLQLIAEGLSRKEIATRLVLALNTVKSHARSIYGKLGVNNQMQAVGKARGLGLLEKE